MSGRSGSSPLTRGKPLSLMVFISAFRLIPAHAGKTTRDWRRGVHSSAHPRSRGENLRCMRLRPQPKGSSPLTRGKHHHTPRGDQQDRLIPAHAGKTLAVPLVDTIHKAHPRSRGENACDRARTLDTPGSSPLTRGKPVQEKRRQPGLWLIPAHAGKTLPDLRFYCADRSDLGNP